MKEYTVEIKPLTPIWTGDANRKNTTLRETGIIGSLRWWYEALIRGLGGYACDPTKESSRCTLDYKKFKKDKKEGKSTKEALDNQNICRACQLFGCTGWARKFRLEVNFNTTISEIEIGTRKRYLKRYVSGFMSDGTITLMFVPLGDISEDKRQLLNPTFLREISEDEWQLLNATFNIIENYGALGAHISQGNGVIKIVENTLPHRDEKISQKFGNNDGADNNLPNLKDFFFYQFQFKFAKNISELIDKKVFWTHKNDHQNFQVKWEDWKKLWSDYGVLPIAFHIRDTLRPLENDRNKRHKIFGELGKGSKVFVSHGYRIDGKTVEVRIFDYDVDGINNTIKDKLQENLKKNLFSNGNDYLESCTLSKEKTGSQLLEELK